MTLVRVFVGLALMMTTVEGFGAHDTSSDDSSEMDVVRGSMEFDDDLDHALQNQDVYEAGIANALGVGKLKKLTLTKATKVGGGARRRRRRLAEGISAEYEVEVATPAAANTLVANINALTPDTVTKALKDAAKKIGRKGVADTFRNIATTSVGAAVATTEAILCAATEIL